MRLPTALHRQPHWLGAPEDITIAMMDPAGTAERIHDQVLQLLAAAMNKVELCDLLASRGRCDDLPVQLEGVRDILAETVKELRSIMADLRPGSPPPLL